MLYLWVIFNNHFLAIVHNRKVNRGMKPLIGGLGVKNAQLFQDQVQQLAEFFKSLSLV